MFRVCTGGRIDSLYGRAYQSICTIQRDKHFGFVWDLALDDVYIISQAPDRFFRGSEVGRLFYDDRAAGTFIDNKMLLE